MQGSPTIVRGFDERVYAEHQRAGHEDGATDVGSRAEAYSLLRLEDSDGSEEGRDSDR